MFRIRRVRVLFGRNFSVTHACTVRTNIGVIRRILHQPQERFRCAQTRRFSDILYIIPFETQRSYTAVFHVFRPYQRNTTGYDEVFTWYTW